MDSTAGTAMTAAANKQTLESVFAATAQGDGRPFIAVLAEDVSSTIIGSTPWSKTYRGKATVLKELLGPLNAQLDGRNTITAHRFVAEGDRVVVEGQGHNTTKHRQAIQQLLLLDFQFHGWTGGRDRGVRRHSAHRVGPATAGRRKRGRRAFGVSSSRSMERAFVPGK